MSTKTKIDRDALNEAAYQTAVAVKAVDSNRRYHINNYRGAAAAALGRTRLSSTIWEQVLDAGSTWGLFRVNRDELSYPFFEVIEQALDDYVDDVRRSPEILELEVMEAVAEVTPEIDTAHVVDKFTETKPYAILVRFPASTADGHRGLHVYLDTFFAARELESARKLAKSRGAVELMVVERTS
tara:strand:- start:203 stop:754 length:552 start_codon:yes stop_codon:yes gene_type:complete